MIKGITLANFKRFKEETYFPLSKINLLTGINGKGKSTLIQSLLLLRQSSYINKNTNKLILNNKLYCTLGSLKDIKNNTTTREQDILIGFDFIDTDKTKDSIQYNLYFNAQDSEDTELNILKTESYAILENKSYYYLNSEDNNEYVINIDDESYSEGIVNDRQHFYNFRNSNLFLYPNQNRWIYLSNEVVGTVFNNLDTICKLAYISADRIGPKLNYTQDNTFTDDSVIDPIGNNTAMFFQKRELDHFDNWKIDESDNRTTLISVIEYWYEQILGKTKVDAKKLTSTIYELRFNDFLATNVGFGYSYMLPIILSVVNAKKDEIIIIENPEAHLHPKAQHNLAKFLYFATTNHNINFIIETHSEHILNGFRVAMVNDKKLKGEDFSILYFTEDDKEIYKKIILDDSGKIENWPNDFFDQNTKDINTIFEI